MYSNFTQLHVYSEYSLDAGFFSIDDYIKFCYENKIFAASITERFNLFSSVKFYKKCFDFGIKPIIGSEVFLEHKNNKFSRLVLLCKNIVGYRNLSKLITKSHLENLINGIPIVKRSWLLYLSEGLIAIGLSFESDIGIFLLENNYSQALDCLKFWNKIFHNHYYLSVTKFGLPIEIPFTEQVLNFVNGKNIPLIATNEVSFLRPLDFLSYKSKIAIFDSNKQIILGASDSYFKNRYFKLYNDMSIMFKDMPILLDNIIEIVKRCNLFFKFKNNFSPKFLKTINETSSSYLSKVSFESLLDKFHIIDKDIWDSYIIRLNMELDIINNIGFADYFLITQDFVIWAKEHNIPIGPGRGSGAGSLVAYLLSITEIDPIKYDLLFERFLNLERVSNPDFDIDFCVEGRDVVIDYVVRKYGINRVSQIITFGSMTIKAVIRDVGRVLGYTYSFVDRIVKLLSNKLGILLKSELVNNKQLKNEYDESYDIQNIINLGLKLEGTVKSIGRHAGGIIISSVDLIDYLPLSYERKNYQFITQLDKNDTELLGFAKFDFLGLKTLTLLSSIASTISVYDGTCNVSPFNLSKLSLCDARTFSLLKNADTIGIFQLESLGIKSIVQQLKPESFKDIIAVVALYRPGPLQSGMLKSFIKRKLGLEKIDYIHDKLSSVLRETYGVVVYQEQVMLIAQIFANYSIASADFLRIAMSKKNANDMSLHLELFLKGAILNGIDINIAKSVFYLVEKFAGYGFNKAHSVGYAMLTYTASWLKSNYNLIFMTALLSYDMDNYKSVSNYINECFRFDITILTPDINRSFYAFTLCGKKTRYGFGAIRGIGISVISEIIYNRSVFGLFTSFFNFLYRLDVKLLSKKTLEALIYSGAFDNLGYCKFKLVLISVKIFDLYLKFEQNSFYMTSSFIDDYFDYKVKEFSFMIEYRQKEFTQEREVLCDFNSNNLLLIYESDIYSISKLSFKSGMYFNIFFCGVLKSIKFKKNAYNLYVILIIDSYYKSYKLILSYTRYIFFKHLIKKDNFLVILSYVNNKGVLNDLFIEDFYLFRYSFAKYLDITLCESFISNYFLEHLYLILFKKSIGGNTTVRMKFSINGKYKYVLLYESVKIALHDDLITSISHFNEVKKVDIVYSF